MCVCACTYIYTQYICTLYIYSVCVYIYSMCLYIYICLFPVLNVKEIVINSSNLGCLFCCFICVKCEFSELKRFTR